jgi:hypothetical protein
VFIESETQLSHSLFDHLELKYSVMSIKLAVAYSKHFALKRAMPTASCASSKRCPSRGSQVGSSSFVGAFLIFLNLSKLVDISDFVRSKDDGYHCVCSCHLILFNPRTL